MLKKEFKKYDVNRIRNIVKGKHDERTTIGIGYKKKKEHSHKEGETWEENGKVWTIKDGVKTNQTQLDKIKKLNQLPLFCPQCGNLTYPNRDNKIYKIHKKCLECVIDMEHELKKNNLWGEYEKNIINSDLEGLIEMYKNFMLEQINNNETMFITEKGKKQEWIGGNNNNQIQKLLEEGIQYLESLKKV